MVIYFDLDDTLYRLYDPFYKAYQKVFHEDLDIYALWKQSRIYSNEIYPKYLNKLITKDELSIYRLKNAFKDLEIFIPLSLKAFFNYCNIVLFFKFTTPITMVATLDTTKIAEKAYINMLFVIVDEAINIVPSIVSNILTSVLDKEYVLFSLVI